jgi:hypothetical protein
MIWKVEIEIEASQITTCLALHFIDLDLGKQHTARFVVRMRQWIESGWPKAFALDLVRCHGR